MDPFQITPPEMWEKIFENLENPSDWLNLYRAAASSFEGAVGAKKSLVLLPHILPFVLPYLEGREGEGLLPLRLLCKSFRKIVDHRLESDDKVALGWQGKYIFEDSVGLSSFTEQFASQAQTAIIGGFFGVDYTRQREEDAELQGDERARQYTVLVSRTLATFGKYITQFFIHDFCIGQENCGYFLNIIGDFVRLAPNLQKLIVGYPIEINPAVEVPLDDGNRPVSVLSKLKSFEYSGDLGLNVDFTEGFQNAILRMCCHPDSLTTVVVYGVPTELLNFTKLEKVEIFEIEDEHDQINFESAAWQLSEFKLRCDDFKIQELFRCAEKFQNTLTSLTIESLPRCVENFQFTVDLPHLKYLKVYESFPFDCLGSLANLEILHVITLLYYPTQEKVDEFVASVRENAAQSNLWLGLRNLKKIVVTGYCGNTGFRQNLYRDRAVQ